jgi:hypothetical protein
MFLLYKTISIKEEYLDLLLKSKPMKFIAEIEWLSAKES